MLWVPMLLAAVLIPLVLVQESPTRDEMLGWIRALGAEDYEQREAAMEKLLKAGEPAIHVLYDALDSKDREVHARIVATLRRLQKPPIHAYFKDVASLVKEWEASGDAEKEYKRLLEKARELSEACDSAAKNKMGSGVFGRFARSTLKDSKSTKRINNARLLHKGLAGVTTSRAVVMISGDLKARSINNSLVIATGSVEARTITNSVIIAGGEIKVISQAQSSQMITPDTVSGQFVVRCTIVASQDASAQILYGCTLINCRGSGGQQVIENKNVTSKKVSELMEFKLKPPPKKQLEEY